MEEHSISTDKFTAIWIPTYGNDDGYYNAAPNTEQDYDLHQYTSGSADWFLSLSWFEPAVNPERPNSYLIKSYLQFLKKANSSGWQNKSQRLLSFFIVK